MYKQKVGKFICEQRKLKNMTQKDFADKLNITDKAVSKWERGLAYPDIALLSSIAKIFDVSVSELLDGEKSDTNIESEKINNDIETKNNIVYDTKKDIPCDQLHNLFMEVGWSNGKEPALIIEKYNIGFLNSTISISAWDNDRLVGCVRVLSDQFFRSVIYDLAVSPEYQNRGIGRQLVQRCMEYFPTSEWLIRAQPHMVDYYKKIGFEENGDSFMVVPSKWF